VLIPKAEEIEIRERRFTKLPPGKFVLFKTDESMVPDMVKAGDGYGVHVTGLTHNEIGYPDMSPAMQDKLVRRLVDKIRLNADKIACYEEDSVEDADIVVISYGITSRVTIPAIEQARREGMKVGHLRLIVAWPFAESRIRELSRKGIAFVVPELNLGQMVLEVERCAEAGSLVKGVPHAGGTVHDPSMIYNAIKEAAQWQKR